jgi:hypothetical protein
LTYKWIDTFVIAKSELFYLRNNKPIKYLSLISFLRKDTITMYGNAPIKGTNDLYPIAAKYLPVGEDSLNGRRVLLYRLCDLYHGSSLFSYDMVFFDPDTYLIIKERSLECGDGVLRKRKVAPVSVSGSKR